MQNNQVATTVLYVQALEQSNANDAENITKAAFTSLKKTNYQEEYLSHTFSVKNTKQKYKELLPWVKNNNVLVIYGHYHIAFKIVILISKLYNKKLILTTDATYTQGTFESKGIKLFLKPFFLRCLYNWVADAVFVPSTAAKNFLFSNGVKQKKIVITPYVVDEDLIEQTATNTNIVQIRNSVQTPIHSIVFVFCAKFIERKRPLDAIKAFAKIQNEQAVLWMIGDGPLLPAMQQKIKALQLEDKIKLLGIINYNELASYYAAASCLVFTSEHEPYGLPVNEAMLCKKPVIVSDKIGARLDLVEEGKTGWVYPTENIEALANCMQQALNKPLVEKMGEAAFEKMQQWSSQTNVDRQLAFFQQKGWLKKQCHSEL